MIALPANMESFDSGGVGQVTAVPPGHQVVIRSEYDLACRGVHFVIYVIYIMK